MNIENTSNNGISSAESRTAAKILSQIFSQSELPEIEADPDSLIYEQLPHQVVSATEILERFERKKESAAENLGILPTDVETLPFDLSQLENEGIFLNVDCRGFSTLERQIEWKSLGIELPKENKVRLSPPRAALLPDAFRLKLLRAAGQAHQALNKYSFRFTLCESVWGTSEYKWVPWSAFENFESEYERACQTLEEAKADVLEHYDQIVNSLRDGFAELAEASAKRLDATLQIPVDQADFITTVVEHALSMVPSREMVRDGLSISMKPKVIVLGSEMLAEQQKSSRLLLENTQINAEQTSLRIARETEIRVQELTISHTAAEQAKEREVKERIRQMKLEAAREAADQAISPIKEGLEHLTGKIYEAAREMTARLEESQFVPGSLAKRARQMCEWYSLMNFTGDSSLDDLLDRLQKAASGEAKYRSPRRNASRS